MTIKNNSPKDADIEPSGYLITGSKMFENALSLRSDWADSKIASRHDGSHKEALYTLENARKLLALEVENPRASKPEDGQQLLEVALKLANRLPAATGKDVLVLDEAQSAEFVRLCRDHYRASHPDAARLDLLETDCLELRCKESHGHDDAYVYFEVIEFTHSKSGEEVIGCAETPRKAIDDALRTLRMRCADKREYLFYIGGLDTEKSAVAVDEKEAWKIIWEALDPDDKDRVTSHECVDFREAPEPAEPGIVAAVSRKPKP